MTVTKELKMTRLTCTFLCFLLLQTAMTN